MRCLVLAWALASAACAPTLAGLARDGSPEDARAVISLLEDRRTGTELLIVMAHRAEPDVRAAALLALGRNEDAASLPVLVAALGDGDAPVRRMAAFALGQLGEAAGEPPLLTLLEAEPHPAVRLEAWRALGRIGGEATLLAASKASDLDRVPALTAVAIVLRRMNRRPEDVAWLTPLASSADPEVRASTMYIYSRSPPGLVPIEVRQRAARALVSDSAAERETAVRVLARSAEGVVAEVRAALQAATLAPHQLAALAGGLGKAPGYDSADALLGILTSSVEELLRGRLTAAPFHAALAAAGALRDREQDVRHRRGIYEVEKSLSVLDVDGAAARRVAMLRCALRDLEECEERERARRLGKRGGDLAALRALATRRDPGVRMAALEALVATDADVAGDLRAALADADLPVAATAAGLLADGKAVGPETGDALASAFKRAVQAGDLESAGDLLTALIGVSGAPAQAACETALASGQLALARIGADGLEKLTGTRPAIPRAPLPPLSALERTRPAPREVLVRTELGDIVLRLETDLAPRTVASFLELAEKHFYDGLTFHRVVPDFVIQGGDPRGDGWGGPGRTLRCENNPLPYVTGTVGMALAGKDTGGSQWFITHSAQPHLFGTYTVFASVVRGRDVVDRIAEGDRILSITPVEGDP